MRLRVHDFVCRDALIVPIVQRHLQRYFYAVLPLSEKNILDWFLGRNLINFHQVNWPAWVNPAKIKKTCFQFSLPVLLSHSLLPGDCVRVISPPPMNCIDILRPSFNAINTLGRPTSNGSVPSTKGWMGARYFFFIRFFVVHLQFFSKHGGLQSHFVCTSSISIIQ